MGIFGRFRGRERPPNLVPVRDRGQRWGKPRLYPVSGDGRPPAPPPDEDDYYDEDGGLSWAPRDWRVAKRLQAGDIIFFGDPGDLPTKGRGALTQLGGSFGIEAARGAPEIVRQAVSYLGGGEGEPEELMRGLSTATRARRDPLNEDVGHLLYAAVAWKAGIEVDEDLLERVDRSAFGLAERAREDWQGQQKGRPSRQPRYAPQWRPSQPRPSGRGRRFTPFRQRSAEEERPREWEEKDRWEPEPPRAPQAQRWRGEPPPQRAAPRRLARVSSLPSHGEACNFKRYTPWLIFDDPRLLLPLVALISPVIYLIASVVRVTFFGVSTAEVVEQIGGVLGMVASAPLVVASATLFLVLVAFLRFRYWGKDVLVVFFNGTVAHYSPAQWWNPWSPLNRSGPYHRENLWNPGVRWPNLLWSNLFAVGAVDVDVAGEHGPNILFDGVRDPEGLSNIIAGMDEEGFGAALENLYAEWGASLTPVGNLLRAVATFFRRARSGGRRVPQRRERPRPMPVEPVEIEKEPRTEGLLLAWPLVGEPVEDSPWSGLKYGGTLRCALHDCGEMLNGTVDHEKTWPGISIRWPEGRWRVTVFFHDSRERDLVLRCVREGVSSIWILENLYRVHWPPELEGIIRDWGR